MFESVPGRNPARGVAPGDVLQALMDIVENPSLPAPFGSIPPNPPFSPVLVFPPNDWTMVLNFPLGTLAPPQTLAIDALGNVWISNPRANIIELSRSGQRCRPLADLPEVVCPILSESESIKTVMRGFPTEVPACCPN